MFLRIKNILKYIYYLIWTKISPNGFAKHIGVNLGERVIFYGMKPGMFGTEPWLVSIGNNCQITANCTFITHDGAVNILRKEIPDLELVSPICIGNDVYIGFNTTILAGTKVGSRSIIGACSLLKGEYPDNSVIVGVPAQVIKSTDQFLEKAMRQSLHTGNLVGNKRQTALKKHFYHT